MVRRAIAALLLLIGAGCGRPDPVSLEIGTLLPHAWSVGRGDAEPPLYLVWVARTRDCLSCQELDFELRRVQTRFQGEVPLLTLHIGRARDASVPRAFLRERRVAAEVRTLSPRAFRRLHGDAVVPSLHLVRDGRIVWTSALRRAAGESAVRLDTLVARYREAAPEASPPARTTAAN